MGLYEHLPYTNFHELNLDWLLRKMKELEQAVADFTGDELQEAVNKYLDEHQNLFPFVTPQLFGAVADGDNDDTAAIQLAVNSGYDVYFPTDHGEIYKVTSTITVPNTCSKLYGSADFRATASKGVIRRIYSTAGQETQQSAIFRMDVNASGLIIANLRFILGTNETPRLGDSSGVLLDAETSQEDDKDIQILNCSIVNATTAIKFNGRGLICKNVTFGSMVTAAKINWVLATDLYDSRAIWFDSCRFHSVTGNYAIDVQSGHAYGLKITNCLADRYLHGLVHCADVAYNWLITGNTCEQVYRSSAGLYLIKFDTGTVNCAITNNVFRSQNTGNGYITHMIYISGTSDNLTISGNVFDGSHMSMIRLSGTGNVTGVVIADNAFSRVADAANSQYAAIQINNTVQDGFAIVGNTLGGTAGSVRRLLSASNVGALTHWTITGNVCASIPTDAYDSTCSVTGNVTSLTI